MNILLKIAWRNVWRNPRRSWVLVTAIGMGIFSFIGSTTFMDGFAFQMVDSAIDLQGGHIEIGKRGHHDNPTIRSFIAEPRVVEEALAGLEGVRYAPEVRAPGMANSPEQAAGVVIHGVEPAREPDVTVIARTVTEGGYLSPEGKANEVLVGAALAKRLKVRLGEKIVLMANDLQNDVSAGAYRVVGLFRTNNTEFDKANVYLHIDEARRLLGYDAEAVTVFSLRLDRGVKLDPLVETLRARLEPLGLEVLSWKDRFPLLVLAMEAYDYSIIMLVVILFTAVAFTLVNAFLMVIFERIREIGIMMANGARPRQIRFMLYFEAIFLLLLGLGAGAALSALALGYWVVNGMDLSSFAAGLGAYGIGTVVYPYFDWGHLGLGFLLIVVMVFLSVLYPAYRAGRFEVVEALTYV